MQRSHSILQPTQPIFFRFSGCLLHSMQVKNQWLWLQMTKPWMNISQQKKRKLHNYQREINLTSGSNSIVFVGLGVFDGYGTYIDNVYLQQIITNKTIINNESNIASSDILMDKSLVVLQNMMNNSFTSTINRIMGARAFFSYLTAYNINFDRLQFYFHHKQNFTQYATIFLYAINFFKQQQGNLLQIFLEQQSPFDKITGTETYLESALNFKSNYTNQYFSSKNTNGQSFVSNQLSFFYYQLPSMLLIHFILWLIFRLIKRYRVSVHLRKYCFLGTIFLLVFEGNLQQFAFYFFTECKFLFSANLGHKFVNIFIISFGFGMIFFAYGALLFFYSYYGKQAKYFIENCKFQILSFVSVCIESGISPLVSAVIHVFFLQNLLLLSASLITMQMSWIAVRLFFLRRHIYSSKVRIVIHISNSALRILFLATLYAYERGADYFVMNRIHFFFMLSYLLLWAVDLVVVLISSIIGLVAFIKKNWNNNKVDNSSAKKLKHKNALKKHQSQKFNVFIQQINDNLSIQQTSKVFTLGYKDYKKQQSQMELKSPQFHRQIHQSNNNMNKTIGENNKKTLVVSFR